MTTTVVFGAGPGLGLSTARRFGQRGHTVVLVARDRDRLARQAAELAGDGIDARAVAGDLSTPAGVDVVLDDIAAEVGHIDVAAYQVSAPIATASSPLEITADGEHPFLEQTLLTPIHAASRLLGPMLDRGSGAVIFAVGSSALGPTPMMSQVGIALAGLRHNLLGVAEHAAPQGVRVGLLVIGGLILGSELQRTWMPDADADTPGALDPDDLAVHIDELTTDTGPFEHLVGPYARHEQ